MRKPIFDRSRPAGRLFYCLISLLVAVGASRGAPPPTPPATTTISDVIYRADSPLTKGIPLMVPSQLAEKASQEDTTYTERK